MRKLIAVVMILLACPAYAATNAKMEVRASADDDTSIILDSGLKTYYFTNDVVQTNVVTLTASGFTTITVPTSAKALMVDPTNTNGVKLKGLTGDQGISMDSTVPIVLPISQDGTVTIGFQNMTASSKSVRLWWF